MVYKNYLKELSIEIFIDLIVRTITTSFILISITGSTFCFIFSLSLYHTSTVIFLNE
jgi:hypothetical protein